MSTPDDHSTDDLSLRKRLARFWKKLDEDWARPYYSSSSANVASRSNPRQPSASE